MIGTTVRGAGSAVRHTDPTWRMQDHRWPWRSPSACWPVPGASVTLARFESLEVNAQGFDFRFERLPRQAQLGRRAGWAGHAAAARGQGGFDEGAFVLGACRHQGPGRPGRQGGCPLQPAFLDGKGVACTQDDGALDDVLQFTDVPGPVVGLKQCQGLLADGPDLLPGSCLTGCEF